MAPGLARRGLEQTNAVQHGAMNTCDTDKVVNSDKDADSDKNEDDASENTVRVKKAEMGFEPMNNGFAIRPLSPLGYSAKAV